MIYGKRSNGGEHGTVFTRIEVVEFILSLSGLVEREDFLSKRVLDPAVGEGAFILCLIRHIVMAFNKEKENIIKSLNNIYSKEM